MIPRRNSSTSDMSRVQSSSNLQGDEAAAVVGVQGDSGGSTGPLQHYESASPLSGSFTGLAGGRGPLPLPRQPSRTRMGDEAAAEDALETSSVVLHSRSTTPLPWDSRPPSSLDLEASAGLGGLHIDTGVMEGSEEPPTSPKVRQTTLHNTLDFVEALTLASDSLKCRKTEDRLQLLQGALERMNNEIEQVRHRAVSRPWRRRRP